MQPKITMICYCQIFEKVIIPNGEYWVLECIIIVLSNTLMIQVKVVITVEENNLLTYTKSINSYINQ